MIDLQPLDIIACYKQDRRSRLASWVNAAFCVDTSLIKAPSHLAVICIQDNKPLLIESTSSSDSPCVITGDCTPGCQAHLAYERIPQYLRSNVHLRLFRLTAMDSLSSAESELLSKILLEHFVREKMNWEDGTPKLTALKFGRDTFMRNTLDKNASFCANMIAKVLMRLGRLNRKNPTLYSPGSLLRQLFYDGTIRFRGQLNLVKADALTSPSQS